MLWGVIFKKIPIQIGPTMWYGTKKCIFSCTITTRDDVVGSGTGLCFLVNGLALCGTNGTGRRNITIDEVESWTMDEDISDHPGCKYNLEASYSPQILNCFVIHGLYSPDRSTIQLGIQISIRIQLEIPTLVWYLTWNSNLNGNKFGRV